VILLGFREGGGGSLGCRNRKHLNIGSQLCSVAIENGFYIRSQLCNVLVKLIRWIIFF
jgi:hypothetical protein